MLIVALLVLLGAYLVGAIPFGWLLARAKGVDIFAAGSGNIGATNVGRVLGRKYGILIFVLDFLKGAVPVGVATALPADIRDAFGYPHALRVGCAVAAFLGHMFPIFLKFRGGKGVATGSGTVFVLVPGPMLLATLAWLATTSVTRMVSLGSLAAVSMLCSAHLLGTANPWDESVVLITAFLVGGSSLLVVKHRANIRRILAGNENLLEDKPMFDTLARSIHIMALGLWVGSMVMFNLITATTIVQTFPDVVNTAPNDRTANVDITLAITGDGGEVKTKKDNLANALFGAAVGPIFPKFFALQGVCAVFALLTALRWRRDGKLHRVRILLLALAALTVAGGWPISQYVSDLRPLRYSADSAVAASAKAAFGTWHLISLALSLLTLLFAGVALALAGKLPQSSAERGMRNAESKTKTGVPEA